MLVHAGRRRRFAGGLRTSGALALTAALFALSTVPAAATPPVTIGAGEITDQSGVLTDSDRTTIQAALDRLNSSSGLQLYVVYVPTFDSEQPVDWAQATAKASGLGSDDVVLAVATEARRYALAPEENGDVTSDEMQALSEKVGQVLRGEDWAGAAVTAADGLREAAASSAGSGSGSDGAVTDTATSSGPGAGSLDDSAPTLVTWLGEVRELFPRETSEVLEQHAVFGRVTPQQKRAMVGALQSKGHVVAMTGDGVNDALALKDADIGVAMGSGAAATRAVAQLVLLDGKFATLPGVVAEGRRVIANIERSANLFVTKTVYAVLIAIAVVSTFALRMLSVAALEAIVVGLVLLWLSTLVQLLGILAPDESRPSARRRPLRA